LGEEHEKNCSCEEDEVAAYAAWVSSCQDKSSSKEDERKAYTVWQETMSGGKKEESKV
jgi:hypothetical protein